MKAYIRTFGCQMNFHDSSRISGLLVAQGYEMVLRPDDADVIIVNTCTVREKARHKAISETGRLCGQKDRRPGTIVVLAGCVAEQDGDQLRNPVPGIDIIVGPDHYSHLPYFIEEALQKGSSTVATGFDKGHRESFLPMGTGVGRDSASQFVTVMKGCSQRCSYCIVPSVRGPERCRAPEDIVEEAKRLVAEGVKEITLLGQKVNGYKKGNTSFTDLLVLLDEIPGLERLRFTSPHPKHMTPALIEAFHSLGSVCESIHLPAQSGSDSVLQAMRRHYTSGYYRETASALRKACPEILISTDLIVGFPGETEADFQETLRLYEDVRFAGAFSFKYSPRPGTYAAEHMEDDVTEREKSRRLNVLHALIDRIELETRRSLVGEDLEILVEGPARKPDQLTGRARNNQIVNFSPPKGAIVDKWRGELVTLTITDAFPHCLQGSLPEVNGV